MKLNLGTARSLNDPDAAAISQSLKELDWERDLFAKLCRDRLHYIQATGSERSGFILEYQDGALTRFFQSVGRVNIETLKNAFVAYAGGDGAWQAAVHWQPAVSHEQRSRVWIMFLAVCLCLAAALILIVLRLLAASHGLSH